jgi:hypothetical protein
MKIFSFSSKQHVESNQTLDNFSDDEEHKVLLLIIAYWSLRLKRDFNVMNACNHHGKLSLIL